MFRSMKIKGSDETVQLDLKEKFAKRKKNRSSARYFSYVTVLTTLLLCKRYNKATQIKKENGLYTSDCCSIEDRQETTFEKNRKIFE